eukprot:CAMPEP_0185761064 /NCGR_PEP_ID=MMETSP1174-20130828/19971_1 /TAXON_ID=35687 /ORGANISM="Dictyocha speculum, Strain CCMP1381" /LENGTH=66 /DNA_ID=CAMNT_0028442133 /DNA_START=1 /DNA_END=201 /DNA_ORIENTATION=+
MPTNPSEMGSSVYVDLSGKLTERIIRQNDDLRRAWEDEDQMNFDEYIFHHGVDGSNARRDHGPTAG